MVPLRFALKNRWWTLVWAAGMCLTAYQFAGPDEDGVAAKAIPGDHSSDARSPVRQSVDEGDLGLAVAALDKAGQK